MCACVFLFKKNKLTILLVPVAIPRVRVAIPGIDVPVALRYLGFAAESYVSWLSNLDLLVSIPAEHP